VKFGHVNVSEVQDTARRSRKPRCATATLAVLGHGRDARGTKGLADVTRLWRAAACSAPCIHLGAVILKLREALWTAAAKLPLWTEGAADPAVPGAFTESSRYGDELKAAASRPHSKALCAVGFVLV